ncbi:MAG: hypothetical protein ABIG63_08685 [Chloroflexota bacterium]
MICKLRVDSVEGEHVHLKLFCGEQEGSLGKCGELIMRIGEYQLFGAALTLGASLSGGHLTMIHDDVKFRKWTERGQS